MEAAQWGEQANFCEARFLHGTLRRRSDRYKREGQCVIPGEIWRSARVLLTSQSAVARPWQRKFLGYSMTWHRKPKLRIAEPSRQAFAEKVRQALRAGRGRSLKPVIEDLFVRPAFCLQLPPNSISRWTPLPFS
jgi:hypothetical protein